MLSPLTCQNICYLDTAGYDVILPTDKTTCRPVLG